jgi:hypothetical protein
MPFCNGCYTACDANWDQQHCISQHKFIKNKGLCLWLPDNIATLFPLKNITDIFISQKRKVIKKGKYLAK